MATRWLDLLERSNESLFAPCAFHSDALSTKYVWMTSRSVGSEVVSSSSSHAPSPPPRERRTSPTEERRKASALSTTILVTRSAASGVSSMRNHSGASVVAT